jgi:acetyl-CoA carboxylase carboxyltransferase component
MFSTGPNVIETVLGEKISQEDLGGARVHAEITGNAHFYALSEKECLQQIKELISYIPHNNEEKAAKVEPKKPKFKKNIENIIPSNPKLPYDVREIIYALVDDSKFFEVQELFAPNIVIGFARMDGETVGFVANQPMYLAGVLDCDASDKAARFIRFCDAFNIPLVTLEDIPGYLPGVEQNMQVSFGMAQKCVYAIQRQPCQNYLILRKAYGGGYYCHEFQTFGC